MMIQRREVTNVDSLHRHDVLSLILANTPLQHRQVSKSFRDSYYFSKTHIRLNCLKNSDVVGLNSFLSKFLLLESIEASRCNMWQLSAVTRPNLVRLGLESICGITDLQPLSACTGLVSINISAYKGTNINPLASSANTMTTLFLWKCPKLTNIVALRLFSNLVTLDLHKNELLEDISPVSVGCSHSLKKLDLSNCSKLSNIYPLSLCTALTSLDLSFCSAIDTISPLCPCKGMAYLSLHQLKLLPPYSLVYLINMWDLKILDVGGINDIHISYLSSCKNLIHLLMRSCLDVHDISGVVNCTKLETLIIRSHILEDISPLASCTSLTRLCLLNTSVSDISALASCTNLKKLEGLHPNVIKEWKKQQKAIAGTL